MAKKRKAGDGLIRQRTDGRWEGRYVVGYDDHGYPKTKAVFGKSKRECTEKLAALKAQLGGIPSDKLRPEMRFADWLDYWYETHCKPNIRTSTQSGYEDRIRLHIKPELGEIPLNRLTQNDLQQFYARLKKSGRKTRTEYYGEGLSDRMVRMCHATCRSALQRAVQDGLIRTNPAEGCKLPPKKAREMQVLARDELQRFLIQAQAEGYYELFLLDLATGLRRGELLALQWDDLDFETGVLTISKQVSLVRGKIVMSVPKTKSSIRKLVLPPAVVQVLKEYRESVHSRWMFPSPVLEDLPLNPGSVYDRLQLILEHANCKQVRFHDLRHTFATLALQNGMDVKTLSAMLGHVSAATTLDIYTHSTSDMQHAAARKIDCGIGKAELPDAAFLRSNNDGTLCSTCSIHCRSSILQDRYRFYFVRIKVIKRFRSRYSITRIIRLNDTINHINRRSRTSRNAGRERITNGHRCTDTRATITTAYIQTGYRTCQHGTHIAIGHFL